MHEESFDVFDREGNITGTASWDDCHTKGLIHKTVALFLFKDASKRETLIHKRSAMMHHSPSQWQHAAGGHVVSGDTVYEGMRKEIQEELFHEREAPEIELREVCTFFNHDLPGNYEFLTIFEGMYPGPFFPNPQEIEGEPRWIEWNELMKNMKENPENYSNVFHNLIKEYMKAGENSVQ